MRYWDQQQAITGVDVTALGSLALCVAPKWEAQPVLRVVCPCFRWLCSAEMDCYPCFLPAFASSVLRESQCICSSPSPSFLRTRTQPWLWLFSAARFNVRYVSRARALPLSPQGLFPWCLYQLHERMLVSKKFYMANLICCRPLFLSMLYPIT